MRQAALAVILCLLCLSCGTRTSPRGPVLILKPILAEQTDRLPDRDAVKHDADIIARRFTFLGCSQLRVAPGEQSISIQFPYTVDDSLVSSVISQRGELAFHLVQEERIAYDALKAMDEKLRMTGQEGQNRLLGYVETVGGDFGVDDADYRAFRQVLESQRPQWPVGWMYMFGPPEAHEGRLVRRFYTLKAEPVLSAPVVDDVRPSPYQGTTPGLQDLWVVSMKLANDADLFAQVTGMNVGRRLAIVVDSVVQSAPVIQDRIPDGNVMIAMYDTPVSKARAMGAVLATGMLRLRWQADTTRR